MFLCIRLCIRFHYTVIRNNNVISKHCRYSFQNSFFKYEMSNWKAAHICLTWKFIMVLSSPFKNSPITFSDSFYNWFLRKLNYYLYFNSFTAFLLLWTKCKTIRQYRTSLKLKIKMCLLAFGFFYFKSLQSFLVVL